MSCIHLAKVPFHTKENVSAHNETIGILFVVSRNRMREIPRLVQDIIHLDAQVEGADVFRNLGIPLPFRLALAGLISFVEHVGDVRIELKLVLGGIRAPRCKPGVQRIQVCLRIQRITGNATLCPCAHAEGVVILVVLNGETRKGAERPRPALTKATQPTILIFETVS